MKLKLSLTKGELESLGCMADRFLRTAPSTSPDPSEGGGFAPADFILYDYYVALESFLFKWMAKIVTGAVKQEKNRVTLTQVETHAFYHFFHSLETSGSWLPPYEDALTRKVLEEIGRQHDRGLMLRVGRRPNYEVRLID